MTWETNLTFDQKEKIVLIQQIRSGVRRKLEQLGFQEVEIPILYQGKSLAYGGIPIRAGLLQGYLRPVLTPYIRRWLAIVKDVGINKVYYIGPCFRSESLIDQIHYPIFEILTLGVLGQDYNYLMELIRDLVLYLVANTTQKNPVNVEGEVVDLYKWEMIKYRDLMRDLNALNSQRGSTEPNLRALGKLNPTFVTDLPEDLFGPARPSEPGFKERSELHIGGIEIGDFSTFLTVPELLEKWYKQKVNDLERLSEYLVEEEQLETIKYLDVPLMTSAAIGLSRLYMVLLELSEIRSTIVFPYL